MRDTLRSNRAFCQGWPEEQVRAYVRNQAGKHFDPEVAAVGLAMDPPD